MIKKVKMYAGQCDCCGEAWEHWHHGWSSLPDASDIEEGMTDQGWHIEEAGDGENRDMHYCPACHKIDDNDNLVVDWSRKKTNV